MLISQVKYFTNMKQELWLEYGFIKSPNNYHDMCWYNEGNASELPYFLKALWAWRNKKDVYFLWRFGKKNHYIRGRARDIN